MVTITGAGGRIQLHVDPREAEAALSIAGRWKVGLPVLEQHWLDLLTSAGYLRWKRRMQAIDQPVTDAEFARFLLSGSVADRTSQLCQALRSWSGAAWKQAALVALSWLPDRARIITDVFMLLTPTAVSFFFAEDGHTGAFFALDPALSTSEFHNRMVHELHHVGYFGLRDRSLSRIQSPVESAIAWTDSFSEGLAMLAAAGGAAIHPQATRPAEARSRWDRDIANVEQDRRAIERFLLDVLHARFTADREVETGRALYGVQGPWYTVGWWMAATVERRLGRRALLDCMEGGPRLMESYNKAARVCNFQPWAQELMAALLNPL